MATTLQTQIILKFRLNLDLLVQPSKPKTYRIGLITDHFFAIYLFYKLHMPIRERVPSSWIDKLIGTNYIQQPNVGLLIHLSNN